ncbi:N-acetyl-gamma-glutamyl-phosphate reductase [Fictibacillus iocasae]|uniref:N-acetyl-gamma-glutamyl-phosphate reductase n=1 Tax=Fictibacillus iocasae TaxID=2715437 RepID=A0ABW2NS27_9BACL
MAELEIGIIGATGFSGVELYRLLCSHPEKPAVTLFSSSRDGQDITEEYPHLKGISTNSTLKKLSLEHIKRMDVVFSCAPSGVSRELLPPLLEAGIRVIDLAGDYRLKDSALYEKWYKKPAPPERWLHEAVYGLSEYNRESIKQAQLIANPGCYPTAVQLALLPLLKNNLIDPLSLITDAKSGLSGAGASLSKSSHYANANESLSIYKMNAHQHIPEMEQSFAQIGKSEVIMTFSTHLVPMTRGILATMYADLLPGVTTEIIYETLQQHYENEHFIRVHQENTPLSTNQVSGSNYCDISYSLDERTGRLTVYSVIDNLLKGAAGQALHNMNIMMGFNETSGLPLIPQFP